LRRDWKLGIHTAFGARYVGRQFTDNANETELGGYAIFSGAVGYHADRWEWSLNADNLFNKDDYFLPGHFSNQVFPGAPITVTTSLRLKWY
jgi:iron complex outermembrane recepter protein